MDTEEKELERLKEILNIAFPESEKEELVIHASKKFTEWAADKEFYYISYEHDPLGKMLSRTPTDEEWTTVLDGTIGDWIENHDRGALVNICLLNHNRLPLDEAFETQSGILKHVDTEVRDFLKSSISREVWNSVKTLNTFNDYLQNYVFYISCEIFNKLHTLSARQTYLKYCEQEVEKEHTELRIGSMIHQFALIIAFEKKHLLWMPQSNCQTIKMEEWKKHNMGSRLTEVVKLADNDTIYAMEYHRDTWLPAMWSNSVKFAMAGIIKKEADSRRLRDTMV